MAGTGTPGFSGDGGPATEADFREPVATALDSAGNLYISDYLNNRIRKVDTAGVITTIAGSESAGFSGDGGPATEAAISNPVGIAFDAVGNLYLADYSNHRVRKVDTSGIITTVAGTGTPGFSGDGGPATEAELNFPLALAVDEAGNLYVSEERNHTVRRIDSAGTIETVAGTGTGGFSGDGGPASEAQLFEPFDIALDSGGNLYIADTANSRLRKVDTSGVITTVAGTGSFGFSGDGGPATEAELTVIGVAVDTAGNIYMVDSTNRRIRKVTFAAS